MLIRILAAFTFAHCWAAITMLLSLPLGYADAPTELSQRLALAGDNRPQLELALSQVEGARQQALQFLILQMPRRDLQQLSSEFLLDNIHWAFRARERTTWGKSIPWELFLNDVLPYVQINERRDNWRKEFFQKCLPLVSDCKTPGEAAKVLNAKLFPMVGVRYSTKRNKPDQSPHESMEIGLASCTGLSILLADACRAVGVPARLAGIPRWVNKQGNHTWVEVWDQGWHFTGAAEPGELNSTWFRADAALAQKDSREHSIYAASFKSTGVLFPMVWAADSKEVHAVNVTARYISEASEEKSVATQRLMVRVVAASGGDRIATAVSLFIDGEEKSKGSSHDESYDLNDLLSFNVPRGKRVELRWVHDSRTASRIVEVGDAAEQTIEIDVSDPGTNSSKP